MHKVDIKIVDSYEAAPNYTGEYISIKLEKCVIVGKGTLSGNPTIDLVFTDSEGNKYIAMTTGKIVEMIGGACAGKRIRDRGR